jgi:hypothetical protein
VALGPAYVTAARKVMEEVLSPLGPPRIDRLSRLGGIVVHELVGVDGVMTSLGRWARG